MKSPINQLKQKIFNEKEIHQSAGILDDYAIRKDVQTITATIGGMDISNDGTKTTIIAPTGDYVRIGDGSTTALSLSSNNDLLVTGKLEVAGTAYTVEQTINTNAGGNGIVIQVGGLQQGAITARNDDGIYIAPRHEDGRANNNIIITKYGNIGKNHDHSTASTNPTLYIHSATDPDTNNTQWLSLTHNQTDGVITTGLGKVTFPTGISGATIMADNGFTGTMTTASLVGKTMTISGGLIIGLA